MIDGGSTNPMAGRFPFQPLECMKIESCARPGAAWRWTVAAPYPVRAVHGMSLSGVPSRGDLAGGDALRLAPGACTSANCQLAP
jgi:hypothetical protein